MPLLSGPLFSVVTNQPPYLDPGSGSFLLQLLIAALAGIGIFIGASWSKVKRLFQGKNTPPASKEEEEEKDDD